MKGHILIVGGTSGIGKAVVRLFAEDKKSIVSAIGRKQIKAKKNNVHYLSCDLENSKNYLSIIQKQQKKFGKLKTLIFLQRYRGVDSNKEKEFKVSVEATENIINYVKNNLAKNASIIIMSSSAAHFVSSEQPFNYHLSKSALESLIKYYAVNLGKKNIRVNGVACGTVIKEENKKFYQKNKKLSSLYRRIIPLGRIGSAKEIAEVIKFLSSDNSSFITGQILFVDGGTSLVWQESLARKISALDNFRITRK